MMTMMTRRGDGISPTNWCDVGPVGLITVSSQNQNKLKRVLWNILLTKKCKMLQMFWDQSGKYELRYIRKKHFFDSENILHYPSWQWEFQKIRCSLFLHPHSRGSLGISMDSDPSNAHSEPAHQVWNLQCRAQPFLTRSLTA